jgi:hypothetical protein
LSTSTENNEKLTNSIIGLGLGGDVGILIKYTKYFCFNIGTTLVWNFVVFNEMSKEIDGNDGWRHIKIEHTGWGNINPIIGIKPYISFGYYFNTKKE